jgi:hypothetical protein
VRWQAELLLLLAEPASAQHDVVGLGLGRASSLSAQGRQTQAAAALQSEALLLLQLMWANSGRCHASDSALPTAAAVRWAVTKNKPLEARCFLFETCSCCRTCCCCCRRCCCCRCNRLLHACCH